MVHLNCNIIVHGIKENKEKRMSGITCLQLWAEQLEKKSVLLSHVLLFATSWTITHQAPLSMEFSGEEDWSG